MSPPPDNNDEFLRDDPSQEEARTWWRKNVDADAQARALVKALQVQPSKRAKANLLDSLLSYWETIRASRLMPIGAAVAAIIIVSILLITYPRSSGDLAGLGALDFESQTLIRSIGLNECEIWVGSKPRLRFHNDNQVTFEADSGTLTGTWALQPSADGSRWEVDLGFGSVAIGAESFILSGKAILSAPSAHSSARAGTLTLTFQSPGKPQIDVQRNLAPGR